ncbi:MAG: hypothetical protein ACRDJX_10540 [Solirubrobacteraceae bacterium]
MQGTVIGPKLHARYYCASRRADHSCDQPLVHADLVEAQLVEFVAGFKPHAAIREEIPRRLADTATADTTEVIQRRAALEQRLRRARDLYELGDLTRPEYIARREAINTELAARAPGPLPDLDQAQQVLHDFSISWQNETDPAANRQLLSLMPPAKLGELLSGLGAAIDQAGGKFTMKYAALTLTAVRNNARPG